MLAFFARLRRLEVKALKWGDIHFDTLPAKIRLRARTTKAKRADSVPLHAQLDAELRAFRPDDAEASQAVVCTVPSMKAFRADLKLAGIEDVDAEGHCADLNSVGRTFIAAMAAHGVNQRAAQAIARHTDPRLTASAYTDELLPLAAEIAKVPAIPDLSIEPPATIPLRATGTDDAPVQDGVSLTAPLHRNSDFAPQNGALHVTNAQDSSAADGEVRASAQVIEPSKACIKRQGPTPSGIGPSSEAGEGGRTLDIHVGNVTLYH